MTRIIQPNEERHFSSDGGTLGAGSGLGALVGDWRDRKRRRRGVDGAAPVKAEHFGEGRRGIVGVATGTASIRLYRGPFRRER